MARIYTSGNYEALCQDAAHDLALKLEDAVMNYNFASIALCGGSTFARVYELLATTFAYRVPWEGVHFFWADERCVPPDDPASSYGLARTWLLDRLPIAAGQVHRLRGEDNPVDEAQRYSAELKRLFAGQLGRGPVAFNVVLLELGPDGHTAGLYPDSPALLATEPCIAVEGPPGNEAALGLTLTLPVINAAKFVNFVVSGADRAAALTAILEKRRTAAHYPAALVQVPEPHLVYWYVDAAANPHHIS
jgi:6-phosphogluconolactonase